MARIKTYPIDTIVSDKDIIIGTDADNQNATKNFSAEVLRNYMLSGLEPEAGGNLKITTITATDEENLTPEDYINNQDPAITVLNYEIIFLILNGRTYIFRRNGSTFGIGETQTISSDFTEIDITSVITSNAQDLQSVLSTGNESDLDAKIKELYLKNNHTPSGTGYVKIYGDKNRLNINNNQDILITSIEKNRLVFHNAGNSSMSILIPNMTEERTATLQNASGTIAYLSDIESAINEIDIPTIEIESSDDTISVTRTGSVVDLSLKTPYVLNTLLRDSLTNTTYFRKGGYFEYDPIKYPIDSVRIDFNYSVGSLLNPGENLGVVYFLYEDGWSNHYYMNIDDANISGSSITIPFPLSEYWSNIAGQRLSTIDICLYPNSVKAVGGMNFNGCISGSISKYIGKWGRLI